MWLLSAAAQLQLSQSHTAVSKVEVLHSGRAVHTLDVVAGSVGAEAGRPVARNLSCTVVDPTGALSGADVDDLLNPYDCEVAPHRGVLVGVTAEYAPLGVFGLTGRSVAGDGSIQLTGQDRAMGYQGPMTGALAISGGTPVEDAIARLLATRRRGVQLSTWRTGFTCGPLLYSPDIDVWAAAQELAKSVGGWLYHDRVGDLQFGPALPTTGRPVARYAESGGLLLEVDRQEDSDSIHNVVVVTSAKTATGGMIRAVAADTDPTSPTFAGGRYGRRVKTITNQHVGSAEQAQQVAATELVRELGRSETVSITAVVDPTRDPHDIITVHRPRAGLVERGLAVASVDIPLGVREAMRIGCRRSILTRDGQVLDVPAEVTAA